MRDLTPAARGPLEDSTPSIRLLLQQALNASPIEAVEQREVQ
jgi:hypothetical protein